jgi:hypothetical protein
MTLDIIHSRMMLLVGDVYCLGMIMSNVVLATIPIHTSNKGEGL